VKTAFQVLKLKFLASACANAALITKHQWYGMLTSTWWLSLTKYCKQDRLCWRQTQSIIVHTREEEYEKKNGD